ncbi:AraC family transcriptional regulator [Mucilaginibacter conchicola]|uniref:AraC family transcriptional regulator n=1 Tax=Mucilaginibacter conchicola TaxID=2303333 RepID=A0A372NV82_9SPHI|nr:helix-turn-helix domain-containing protein [Mucilaginibacter conchicola]RFZ94026.1 AraC family transcriptional regulator [Mucilaginibacter conchicola]
MSHLLDSILCGSVLLLAVVVLINAPRVNVKANKWFAAFMFCFFLVCLQNVLLTNGLLNENDKAFELLAISNFVLAPLFYLSVSFYVKPVITFRFNHYLHFVFAAFVLIITLISFRLDAGDYPDESPTGAAENIFNSLFSIQVTVYCLLAAWKIIKYQRGLLQHRSVLETIDLNWLKHISIGVLIMSLFWTADIVFQLSEHYPAVDIATSLVYLSGTFYIANYWLKQKEVFPYSAEEKKEINTIIDEPTATNRKDLLTDDKLATLKAELLELLDNEKPYIDADLNLIKLAEMLKVSAHILSYVINAGFNENFYQLINRYRVEEAKRLIPDPKMAHLSLLGIGFEVGFNSKSVFNSTFKKVTGLTPSAYKASHANKKES